MSTTTPSHIETIRAALEQSIKMLTLTSIVYKSTECAKASELCEAALASLESLSRQPPQAPDIDKIMEVVGGEANGAAERIAQEISEPRKALEQMCSFIRLRLYNELRVAPRQPAQTEDLEAKARTFIHQRYPDLFRAEVREFVAAQAEATIMDCAAFARSLSEPK